MIILIVNEIVFRDAIERASREEGMKSLCLKDEDAFWAALQELTPKLILLEIGIPTLDGAELIQKLKRNSSTRKIPIVAFGNSLRADLLQDAKEMGADLVLPKSAFREQLPEIIRHYDKQHK